MHFGRKTTHTPLPLQAWRALFGHRNVFGRHQRLTLSLSLLTLLHLKDLIHQRVVLGTRRRSAPVAFTQLSAVDSKKPTMIVISYLSQWILREIWTMMALSRIITMTMSLCSDCAFLLTVAPEEPRKAVGTSTMNNPTKRKFLVAMPGAPSSVLPPSRKARSP